MKNILILSIIVFIFSGCEKVNTYNTPFVPDNYNNFYLVNHGIMCVEKPESMFCTDLSTIGDLKPTEEYLANIVNALRQNTKYKESDHWHYTETVYEYQVRDCEDEVMTMIHHMVDDGIDKKYLFMVYRLTSKTSAHMFVGVKTDNGIMHMDVNTGIAPIEENINWYMPMSGAGVRGWVRGNIE